MTRDLGGGHGEVVLMDWGCALSISDEGAAVAPPASDIRAPLGTPVYMPPELALARWLSTLETLGVDEIQHRPGKDHGNADGFLKAVILSAKQREQISNVQYGATSLAPL